MQLRHACTRVLLSSRACRVGTHRHFWLTPGTCSTNMACSSGSSMAVADGFTAFSGSGKATSPAAGSSSKPQWRAVTTAFVRRATDGRVLVVRRSSKVSTYRGMWGGVSGGAEGHERLVDRAMQEVLEEAGIAQHHLKLLRCGRPLPVVDGHRHFLVHPFLFDLVPGASGTVTLNWENTAHAWVTPEELCARPHVPLLPETLSRVLLPPTLQHHLDYLVQDREHGAAQLAAYVVEAFAAQLQPGRLLEPDTTAATKRLQDVGPAASTSAPDTHVQQDQAAVDASDAATAATSAAAAGVATCAPAATPRRHATHAATAGTTSSSCSVGGQSGQQVLEQLLDFGFLLATCRPSMAAIANAAAAVLLRLQRQLTSRGSSGQDARTSVEVPACGPDVGAVRAALQASVQEEGARLGSMATACSSHASCLLVELLCQQSGTGMGEQLASGSRRAVLTTSISSAVHHTLIQTNKILTANSNRIIGSSTAGDPEEANSVAGASADIAQPLSVIVCESRPLCEGVTMACQLSAAGLNTTIITDAQAYSSLQEVGVVLLGCDAITQEGPVNKVGSALLALAAHSKGIPVVVVGDSLKVSPGPVMTTCMPYVLGSGRSSRPGQLTAGGGQQHSPQNHGGEEEGAQRLPRHPHTAVQDAAVAQEEEMDWRELSSAWKADDAATVSDAAAATEQQQLQPTPGRRGGGALRVRNVYFEAIPWSLVDRLVVETGALDASGVAAQIGRQRAAYADALQLTLLT